MPDQLQNHTVEENIDGGSGPTAEPAEDQVTSDLFALTVKLPHNPQEIQILVSTQEQVQDIRQSVIEQPDTYQYSCFHLEHNGTRVNDYVELSDVPGISPKSELVLIEDPYTEKEARIHLLRVRELVGATVSRVDTPGGIAAGMSLFDGVDTSNNNLPHPLSDFDFKAEASLKRFLPVEQPTAPPKCVKELCLSAWNPPPYHLRQKGHLMYLQVNTLENELVFITSHVSGFYVNRCTTQKFDPFPKTQPKAQSAHSLLMLLGVISPSFNKEFKALQEYNAKKDPLIAFAATNAILASPWLVPGPDTQFKAHVSDIARPQEQYLLGSIDGGDSLRDFNEEFQSSRELPRETVQERVFRERLLSKLFADYTEAAVRGAVLIAKGDVAPLNPTEAKEAQIYVHNNIFFSHGADGVGTFVNEGGDEAARVATGKDVMGVKAVNTLDIHNLHTPATVVVDYIGRRLVAQSIVPGIFRQRDEGQSQIDYGGVEGKDVIAANENFVPLFEQMGKALRVKKHSVWDKERKQFELVTSVETKGLLGTDGRKYVLDLYRTAPLDIDFITKHWKGVKDETGYPHRMSVLRPELIEAFWKLKMREYVSKEILKKRETKAAAVAEKDSAAGSTEENGEQNKEKTDVETIEAEKSAVETTGAEKTDVEKKGEKVEESQDDRIDMSAFNFGFNPDVGTGQIPVTEEDKTQADADEKDVREACTFLVEKCIPALVEDLKEGDVGSPMDGHSLTRLMHKRGINIRYLGTIATLATEHGNKLASVKTICVQDMIARAAKHILNFLLRGLPHPLVAFCISHFLNCFLGSVHNPEPKPVKDDALWQLYHDADISFMDLTVGGLREKIEKEVQRRFRYDLDEGWENEIKHLQMLREIALKVGLQIAIKDYNFGPPNSDAVKINGDSPVTPTTPTAPTTSTSGRKNRKKSSASSASGTSSPLPKSITTFTPDDIMNIIPLIKDSSSKSQLAEEALEAGRISIIQDQKELGQELLLESLSLHEQIYCVLHPEVARVYNTLSMLYYQLDEKSAAVELARKAVIVSERTLGVDSTETILNYLNLGLFEHANGDTKAALAYIKHAFGFWRIIYGDGHPDSVTTMNNTAVMLQALKHYTDSRKWFEASLAVCEDIFGKTSANAATLSFQLAQALALDSDSKGSVNRMRDAYNVFLAELGPNDRNTKEAENWLEQLTQNAVALAKQAKESAARRRLLTPRVTMSAKPQPQVGQGSVTNGRVAESTTSAVGRRSLDNRDIEELVQFIENNDSNPQPKKRTGKTNPKRRGACSRK